MVGGLVRAARSATFDAVRWPGERLCSSGGALGGGIITMIRHDFGEGRGSFSKGYLDESLLIDKLESVARTSV